MIFATIHGRNVFFMSLPKTLFAVTADEDLSDNVSLKN
jgi:hypothetical protein